MRRTANALVAGLAVLSSLGACGGGDEAGPGLDALDTPTFGVEDPKQQPPSGTAQVPDPTRATTAPTATTPPVAGDDSHTPTPTPTPTPTTGTGTATGDTLPVERVSFDDPVGDATPGVGTSEPPPWSDLAGASLERREEAYRLAVRLGGDAPRTAPGSETMNIATFYDVDGDGDVDHEIWVNLDGEGWGAVRYDDRGTVAPGEGSNVTIDIEGDSVVLRFPETIIDAPERLRFSVASEYGDLEVIGTDFARRDDAPDDDRAVSFP
jgi:hypothetical protein